MINEGLAQTDTANHTALAYRWYVLIMMCLVYTLSITDRYMLSTVLEPIRLELKLTDQGIGFMSGWSLGLFYITLGFPLAWLIDRSNRRYIIVGSLLVWSAMTVSCGLARNYWQLFAGRVGVGIGEAGGTPGANSIISDYFPASRRPMAATIFSLGAPIGAWIALAVAGAIADREGWRASFLWLGAPGIIAGILIYLTVKEPKRGQLDALKLEGEGPSFLQSMRYLWLQRSAVHVMVGSALTALWGWGLAWWTPAFLSRTYSLSTGQAAGVTDNIHLIGGSVATVLTGMLMAHPSMRDPRRIVKLMGCIIGVATIASFGIYYTHDLRVAKLLFWIFIPSIYFYIGPCFGLLLNLAEPRMRAMFCATTLFAANLGNLIIAPQVVGFLSDVFSPTGENTAASLRLAMLCLVPTGFWATLHYFLAVPRLIQDQERATGIRATA
jgi:predicted MFS family arabinose efflux permease